MLPDLVRSVIVVSNSSLAVSYTFTELLLLLITRSLQVALPILFIMRLRNVSWPDYGFVSVRPWQDPLTAVALTFICYFGYYAVAYSLLFFGFDFSGDYNGIPEMTNEASLSLGMYVLILLASAANGFAEELAMRSYLLVRLSELTGSKAVAVISTSILFAAYHCYQGRLGVISALIIGLILGTYFSKTKRFWPIAITHFIMDALPLTLIAASAE